MMTGSAPATSSTSTGKEEDEDYMTEFLNLYPFAGVDFFVSESRENGEGDLAANEHTITKAAEDHYYAEPEECLPCAELHQKIEEQENEIAWLKQTYVPGYYYLNSNRTPYYDNRYYDHDP